MNQRTRVEELEREDVVLDRNTHFRAELLFLLRGGIVRRGCAKIFKELFFFDECFFPDENAFVLKIRLFFSFFFFFFILT